MGKFLGGHILLVYSWIETVFILRWLGTIHVWLHHKIKMLVLAKGLPTGYLKESAFTKHLLIYLLQQTKVFNCGLNAS